MKCQCRLYPIIIANGQFSELRLKCDFDFVVGAARIVTNGIYDVSAANLIKKLNWPTVTDMIKSETATITDKAL